MANKIRILFLCEGNSCRSQMAEGFARSISGSFIEAHSAGYEARGLDPRAVAVMREGGIDISKQSSKTLEVLGHIKFDYVVTVCGEADESCPVFPGQAKVIHRGFDDPSKLAMNACNEKDIMDCYRRVRDEIMIYISELSESLRLESF